MTFGIVLFFFFFFCIQYTSLAVHEIVLCINNLLLLISGYYTTFLKAINPLNPGGSEVKASAWNAGDLGSISDPWVGKIPWRWKWQPTPVLLPGESHGGRSLVGYSPWGRKESDMTERLHFHFQPTEGKLTCFTF